MDSDEALQIFDGAMLSDAGLDVPFPRGVNARFRIDLSGANHVDWLYHIRDALEVLDVRVSPEYPKPVAHRPGRQPCIRLSTLCDLFLTEQYYRWYRCGRKEVPTSFQFTPLSLANAFMGDGSSRVTRAYPLNKTVYTQLCTESYGILSIWWIEREFSKLGIETSRIQQYGSLKRGGSGIRVNILQGSIDKFMNIVEPFILPSYMYKVKRRVPSGQR